MSSVSIAVAALLVAAEPAGAGSPACQGALSGAVQGTFACSVTMRPGEEGQAVLAIEARGPIPGVPAYSPGAFEVPLPPRVGKYTLDSLGRGIASVAAEGGTLYTAARTFSQRGEVELVLESVRKGPAGKDGWVVHGSYRARLLPVGSGKTGEVVVEVKF